MPKWRVGNSQQFTNNLNKTKINDLHKYLQHMGLNLNSVTKESVTDMCHKISDIFTEAHELTQRNKHHSPVEHPNSPTQKPWFGIQCRRARAKNHLAKKIHRRNPSQTNETTLTNASKLYKRKMNFHINKFN